MERQMQFVICRCFGRSIRVANIAIFLAFFMSIFWLNQPALGQTKDEAIWLYKHGMEALQYERYEEALDNFARSFGISVLLGDLESVGANSNNIGIIYNSIGKPEKALPYYEGALQICRDFNRLGDIAITLNNIATVYRSLGQYERALSYHEEALKIYRQLKSPNIAMILQNIASIYRAMGQYEKALFSDDESLNICKEIGIPLCIALSFQGIGASYAHLGQYERALSNYNEALKIHRQLKDSPGVVDNLINIGLIYLGQRNYKEAEMKFVEARRTLNDAGYITDSSTPYYVELCISTERYHEVLRLLENMRPEYQSSEEGRMLFYSQKGVSLRGVGSFNDASVELLKAVMIAEHLRRGVKERVDFFTGWRIRPYKALVAALSDIAVRNDKINNDTFFRYGSDSVSSAFYFSELTKARTMLEEISLAKRKAERVNIPEELRKQEEELLNQVSATEQLWEVAYKRGENALDVLRKRQKRLSGEIDQLISEIGRRNPMYAALYYPAPLSPANLLLKDTEVLLEYELTDKAGYLFLVEKGNVKKLIKISKGKEDIEALVNEFMLPLQSQYTKENFSPSLGQKLYSLLLEEALKDISPDKNIIIVPDGILGLLPFEALVMKAGGDYKDSLYVGDKYKISYSQSATVLALNRILKPSQAAKPLFALGNPIYDKNDPRYIAYRQGQPQPTLLAQNKDQYSYRALATRREWGKTTKDDKEGKELVYIPLPETEGEVTSIAKLFGVKPEPQDVLLGVHANETELKKASLKDYRYIHFATHADLPGKVQGIKEPFLLLGQVENEEGDDGFLTLTKVLDLKLDADLVVLSACMTGRGKVMEGEGVANFARAFQHAGARSVVVSLWEVASEETVEYMKLFYEHLKDGKSKSEALRLARTEIKKRYPNPFYWAPFILQGEG